LKGREPSDRFQTAASIAARDRTGWKASIPLLGFDYREADIAMMDAVPDKLRSCIGLSDNPSPMATIRLAAARRGPGRPYRSRPSPRGDRSRGR
jgi:hypothetical protein